MIRWLECCSHTTSQKGKKKFNMISLYSYFRTFNLRCRERTQSFIEQSDLGTVQGICSSAGRLVRDNLCISRSTMVVYDVISDMNTCNILRVTPRKHYVIVACYNVDNICRPTHYEPYRKEKPGNVPCI